MTACSCKGRRSLITAVPLPPLSCPLHIITDFITLSFWDATSDSLQAQKVVESTMTMTMRMSRAVNSRFKSTLGVKQSLKRLL